MPLELLMELGRKELPTTLTDVGEIDKLRVLRAAGHVVAMLPAPHSEQPFARVLLITEKGRRALDLLLAAD